MGGGVIHQRRWLVLLIIWLIFVVHGADRSVVAILLEPIRRAFHLNDAQAGVLVGLGYAVPFALAGIPLGAIADRVHRVRLLAGLLALWSTLTMSVGLASSYPLLVLARAGVGATEAGAPPVMLSLLGDTFDARTRPAALSIYYTGPFVGLMAGSTLAGAVSQSHGWRAGLFAVGLPGILLAVVVALVLREPLRGRFEETAGPREAVPIGTALAYIWRHTELRRLVVALVLGTFVTLAVANWTPALLQRVYGLSQVRSGLLVALAIGFPGVLGSLSGGALAQRFGKGEPRRLSRLSGLAILLATPLAFLAPFLASAPAALILLGLWSFVGSAYLGPGWGLAIAEAPAHMRGTIMATALVLANLVGAGLGPQVVGGLSDLFAAWGDAAHLPHALSAVSLVSLITAGLFLTQPARVTARPSAEG